MEVSQRKSSGKSFLSSLIQNSVQGPVPDADGAEYNDSAQLIKYSRPCTQSESMRAFCRPRSHKHTSEVRWLEG